VVLKWVMPTGSANPSGGFGTKDAFGSFNLGRRGESAHGNVCSRADDKARCSAERADSEKLNHERGVRPLAVSASGDGARPR
jgi:hypothetical protein